MASVPAWQPCVPNWIQVRHRADGTPPPGISRTLPRRATHHRLPNVGCGRLTCLIQVNTDQCFDRKMI